MVSMPTSTANRAKNTAQRKKNDHQESLHLKRICGSLEPLSESKLQERQKVRILLNDISLSGLGLFSLYALPVGEEFLLHLSDPISLKLKVKVTFCQNERTSPILSKESYHFRSNLKFIISEEEEENISLIIKKIKTLT